MATLKVEGLDELQTAVTKKCNLQAAKQIVKLNGAELQQKMKRKADFKKGYQTGTTKRSIALEMKDAGLTAEVEPGTEYSPYLEYGTRFMEAQPFVRPAYEAQAKLFKADMQRLVK